MTSQPGYVEEQLGGAPVDVTVAGELLDASDVGPITIRRGRSRPDERFPAATASVSIRRSGLAALPSVGSTVNVALTGTTLAALGASAGAATRFAGRVTDGRARPESTLTGPAYVTIVAAGPRSRLGQLTIGDLPWPAELDGARAARILTEAHAQDPAVVAGLCDAGTVTVLARDVDAQDPGSLLDTLSEDTGGECVELRDGTLVWRDAQSRQNVTPALELAAGNVAADVDFSEVLAGLCNDLRLYYDVETVGQPYVHVTDALAIDSGVGRFSARQRSQLATQADAQIRAVDVVGRRGRARWRVDDGLRVDLLRTLTHVQAAALLGADVGFLARLTGFPDAGPFVTARMWVEGWTETLTRNAWTFALDVAEYGETGAAPRWVDVP